MYGIEAINEANGWNMAAVGITVVFSSLIILSLIISQLHRILTLWDKRKSLVPGEKEEKASGREQAIRHPYICPDDINEIAEIWAPLAKRLNDPFSLADLYKLAAENDFPHPHLTINRLRRENVLMPVENQMFTWNHEQM